MKKTIRPIRNVSIALALCAPCAQTGHAATAKVCVKVETRCCAASDTLCSSDSGTCCWCGVGDIWEWSGYNTASTGGCATVCPRVCGA